MKIKNQKFLQKKCLFKLILIARHFLFLIVAGGLTVSLGYCTMRENRLVHFETCSSENTHESRAAKEGKMIKIADEKSNEMCRVFV